MLVLLIITDVGQSSEFSHGYGGYNINAGVVNVNQLK
jgi:hypothetical protein